MTSRTIPHAMFKKISGGAFAVDYWGEGTECYGEGPPRFGILLHDRHISDFLTDDMSLAFGEAYMTGRIDVEGDLADVVALAIRNQSLESAAPGLLRTVVAKTARIARRSLKRQRDDIAHHYDLGNDFFASWLDDSMTYSCAYYRTRNDTLEQAQTQKLDHSLRKLRLQPDEKLLDIGCGWGSLAVRAAETHDVDVLGITLSEEQRRRADEIIRERHLENRVEIRAEHYETLAAAPGVFDKIVSIGMMEHVGKPHLAGYVDAVHRLLRPGGLALLHLITCRDAGPLNLWLDKYIFPGGYIPGLPEVAGHLTQRGFRIWDVENIGPHYQLTLDHWSERFERNIDSVRQRYGETFVRMWRLYLRGCSAAFREGTLDVHQILVSRGHPSAGLLTRD